MRLAGGIAKVVPEDEVESSLRKGSAKLLSGMRWRWGARSGPDALLWYALLWYALLRYPLRWQ